MRKYSILFTAIMVLILILLIFIGCKQDTSTLRAYHAPENISDGLQTGSIEDVNIDKEHIEKALNDIERGKYGEIHSLLIYKDDKLVVEEYFAGHHYSYNEPNHHGELVTFTNSTVHVLHSATKSITSACTGIAVDKGFIESVDKSIFDYLPDYKYLDTDGKDKITVEHLVTMTSGLKWDEWSRSLGSQSNDIIGIWFSDKDPIEYVLERPLKYEPGTKFIYSGGCMIILGEVIKNASGMDIAEFSKEYLFNPLGIDSFEWYEQFENGVYETGGGLKGIPRDMVKIGVTYLNNGVWSGKQIISKEWIKNSVTTFPVSTGIKVPGEDYGRVGRSYSWWTKEFSNSGNDINMFWAGGWGGQQIMVFPQQNMVVVFTAGNYTSKAKSFTILEKYILPAI